MLVESCTVEEFFAHPDAPALLAEYAEESSIDGLPPACPDNVAYEALERSGALTLLVAREEDRLLGFVVLLVYQNPHYSVRIGVGESIFVANTHRKTGAGDKLRKAAEHLAARQGAVGVLFTAPLFSRFAEVLDAAPAYVETNRVFFRPLS